VVVALQKALNVTNAHLIREVKLDQLRDGMILAADLKSILGTLLCAKGTEVNSALRMLLRNYACNQGICGSIKVFMPIDMANVETRVLEGAQGTGRRMA
jgi:hypothetical protein